MKDFRVSRISLGLILAFLVASLATAADLPLTNWTVPPYAGQIPSMNRAGGGIRLMTDISNGVSFVAMNPCRVVDTRPSQGFAGAYGPPIMLANAIRTFDINSAPHCPGIPDGVEAYSLNFAVTETTGAPGDIRVFPTGAPVSTTSVLNWDFVGPSAIANAIIIPAGTSGSIDILVAGFNTHLVIDINGYFTDTFNTDNYFSVVSNCETCLGVIFGQNTNTTTAGFGGHFIAASAVNGAAGVRGLAQAGTGQVFGLLGETNSTSTDAAGVKGYGSSGPMASHNCCANVGVNGESKTGTGVAGGSENHGGFFFRRLAISPFTVLSTVFLASAFGTDYGVYTTGDYGGTGAKYFVEPHPTDATKVIRYISLEGPESGTYFRGKGRFQNGLATIDVPEDFRIVTDEEGLSIQVTPIGQMATVAVQSIDLNQIVVRGSRNVEFFYMVNGIRRAFKDHQPITDIEDGGEFLPMNSDEGMPGFPAELQRRLISNGTYKQDGTVNMETARRLGWDRIWAERERPSPAP